MQTAITEGVKISVEVAYQPAYSKPNKREYMHAYRVTIENQSQKEIQLLSRHWYIFDSTGQTKEVKGEGVVGKQPVLKPGEQHQYVSWSAISTELGCMYGSYRFRRIGEGSFFEASIPRFELIPVFKYN